MQSSNGKLAARLDASLADYRERQAKRREKKAINERIARAERRAAARAHGIGDDDDDDDDQERAEWETDDDEDDGPVYPRSVPAEVDWEDFLRAQGWADEAVLSRQRTDYVHKAWRLYSFQLETGLLHQGLL